MVKIEGLRNKKSGRDDEVAKVSPRIVILREAKDPFSTKEPLFEIL